MSGFELSVCPSWPTTLTASHAPACALTSSAYALRILEHVPVSAHFLTQPVALESQRHRAVAEQRGTSAAGGGRLTCVAHALQLRAQSHVEELQRLASESASRASAERAQLDAAHAKALAELGSRHEGAMRAQLSESLSVSARDAKLACEAAVSTLTADLAAAEPLLHALEGAREQFASELRAERAAHEACRLQLASAQAALARVRNLGRARGQGR